MDMYIKNMVCNRCIPTVAGIMEKAGYPDEEMYGHMLGEGHTGGMMNDMLDGETQWMHHMDEEHDEVDEHFGGFDMTNHSFSYTFRMNKSDSSDDLHFQGIKQIK